MNLRVHTVLFITLLLAMASLAYGLNYMWFTGSETTVFGEQIRFWHGDTLSLMRTNDCMTFAQDTPVMDPSEFCIMSCSTGVDTFPGLIPGAPPLPVPERVSRIRDQAIAQGHYFFEGDTMKARVHIKGDTLRIWWAGMGMSFDTAAFSFHALPESAVVFFDCPVVHLWGTVSTTLVFGCAGRAGLEDNLIYASSDASQYGRITPDHAEKFALVAEGEIKILNTWANGRENSHGRGNTQTNRDSTDIFLNGAFIALGESFTFEQQNDPDSGYVYQLPQGTPHQDDRGQIWLWGTVAQKRRGYFHRSNNSSTGYLKKFAFDRSLKFWNLGVFDARENVFEPAALDFGAVPVGGVAYDTLRLINEFVPVSIDHISTPLPFYSQPQDSYRWQQVIPVQFAPSASGEVHETLRIYNAYYDQWFSIPMSGTGVSLGAHSGLSLQLSAFILKASPNPFNPSTEVSFTLPQAGEVSVKVFDILGQRVATLQDGIAAAGEHRVSFDGGQLPAGIYLLRLEAAAHQRTLKLVLLK
jgi:hypothetical protein